MSDFTTVAKAGDIPPGEGVAFPVNGRTVAVFNDGGRYFAIDDFCPHMGASLAGGHLKEGVVTCPWHGARFCVRDGQAQGPPAPVNVRSYPVRVTNSSIEIEV